jgi:O-antigen ligase
MAMPSLWERQVLSTLHIMTHVLETSYGQLWEAGWHMGWGSPWWGGGVHRFREECELWMRMQPEVWCNLHPHHMWLEIWAESGVVGIVVAMVTLGAMLRRGWIPRDQRVGMFAWWGLGVTLVLRCFPLTASTSFFVNWSAGALWLVAGWWMGERDRALHRQDSKLRIQSDE